MSPQLTIVFVPAEEGGYTAYIPEIPGAISEGDTVEEARDMVMEALAAVGAYRREQDALERPLNAFTEPLVLNRALALA